MSITKVSSITAALESQIGANLPSQTDSGASYTVSRGKVLNGDPSKTPWVGVYKSKRVAVAAYLGAGTNFNQWETQLDLHVAVQAVSHAGGDVAESLLEEYVQDVLTAVFTDLSIGGTVDTIIGFEEERQQLPTEDAKPIYLQSAITLHARLAE